jgi:molybdate transport system permease protein
VTDLPLEASALLVSLEVSLAALALVLPVGLVLAYYLARGPRRGRELVDALVTLPLVLPPTATGVAILAVFGARGIGPALARAGLSIVATWRGAALASAVVALPIFVRVARTALEGVDRRLEDAAALLGASRARVAWTVTLPLASRGLGAATVLAFARALGEFGATILVAGSIRGVTETLPLAIFEAIEDPAAAGGDPWLGAKLCLVSAGTALALSLVAAKLERGVSLEARAPAERSAA